MTEEPEFIETHYDELGHWVQDPEGYFLIRVNKEKKSVEVAFCKKNNEVLLAFTGKKPQDLYYEITQRKLISRLDHAAYLGKELEKAFLALKYDKKYVQDSPLEL